MCGIAGIVPRDPGQRPDRGQLQRMVEALARRGPDAQRIAVTSGFGLAVCRLAITEIEAGRQPASVARGALRAALNGQIYNYQELRRDLSRQGQRFTSGAEVEVLARGFRLHGERLPELLDGMYSLAVWDGAAQRLLLARDPAGQKPLYYAELPEALLFASEPKALLAHPEVSRDLDPLAVQQYLLHDYVPAPRTIYAAIRKLEPGEARVYEGARFAGSRFLVPGSWFGAPQGTKKPGTRAAPAARELLRLLENAVRKRTPTEVPYCVQLSGGLDSSLVAALLARNSPAPVSSFSIGFDDPSYDESRYARLAAEAIGSRHHETRLTPDRMLELVPEVFGYLDEPLADPSAVPTYLLARTMRGQDFPVTLAGDGGDELWAGYETFQVEPVARALAHTPGAVRQGLVRAALALPVPEGNMPLAMLASRFVAGLGLPAARRHQVWLSSAGPDLQQELLAAPADAESGSLFEAADRAWAASQGRPHLERLLALYFRLYLGDGVLAKADRMSMAHAVEVRAPFLDREVIAFSRQVAARHKLRLGQTKVLLKQAASQLLPPAISRRPKKGFGMPVSAWLRGPLRPEACRVLEPGRLARQGLFRPGPVQRLLGEHLAGRRDHRKALWALLAFQWWHESWA